jgi:DNA replication protein DnaC
LVNSNLEFAEWGKIFHNERMTTAIIDRLIHNSKIILFNGESYRCRNRRQGIKGN